MRGAAFVAILLAALSPSATAGQVPPELTTPRYRVRQLDGIGRDPAVDRQDPSNVLKVRGRYYVWYTQRRHGVHPYASTVYYATSQDGLHWEDRGEALGKGPKGAWDSFGVITPYVAAIGGKYYLYYTGTTATKPFKSRGDDATLRHIGVAVAETPDGPWRRFEDNPILSPTASAWDSLIVDDTHLIVRGGKCWLYYKGGHHTIAPRDTQWGLALGDGPTGPFAKSEHNPLVGGHTVCLWPHRKGLAALVDNAGPERFTVQWSPDGLRWQRAAKLKRVHTGCGPYAPDAFDDVTYGRGIRWGVAQERRGGRVYIVRFDVALQAPPPKSR
ncbi:MAG: family 43 glycosylhydrolase [Planctomycetota bacterium]